VVVEFLYDGTGRRLSKVITDDTGDDTLITTWMYHYLGGQITTIEVDAVEVDDSEPPEETAVRDETLHIHLGPNGQPLSFEWERYDYDTATTLSDTYYYHYDIHGSVVKITDDSADVKISYEYDSLGAITLETNPDSITNPFRFRAFKQVVYDEYTDLYCGSCYYKPDTGTSLTISGFDPNPISLKPINAINQLNRVSTQITKASVLAASTNALENEGMSATGHGETSPKEEYVYENPAHPNLPWNDDDDTGIKIPSGGSLGIANDPYCTQIERVNLHDLAIGRYRMGWTTRDGSWGNFTYSVPLEIILQVAIDTGNEVIVNDFIQYQTNLERIKCLEKLLEEETDPEEIEKIKKEIERLKKENRAIIVRIQNWSSKNIEWVTWVETEDGEFHLSGYELESNDGKNSTTPVYLKPPKNGDLFGDRIKEGEVEDWKDAWKDYVDKHGGYHGASNDGIIWKLTSLDGIIGFKRNKETGEIILVGINLYSPEGSNTNDIKTSQQYLTKNNCAFCVDSLLQGFRTTYLLNIQSWLNPNLFLESILP